MKNLNQNIGFDTQNKIKHLIRQKGNELQV